jgi:hypothetical protein
MRVAGASIGILNLIVDGFELRFLSSNDPVSRVRVPALTLD